MTNRGILVLGATGAVGAEVRQRLMETGEAVVGASRRPADASARLGGRWVELDLERPETFAPALAGIGRVFLISRPGDEQADRVAAPLVDAMVRAEIEHVVDLSAMGAEKREEFSTRRVERLLEGSGLPWTHLRPSFFFQVFTAGALHRGIVARGEIRLPAADARISYLDARDVAGAAVAALTTSGHAMNAYTLTGPEALDHTSIASEIERVSGRAVRYVAIDEDETRRNLALAGFPPAWIERLIGFYRLVRAGACAPVTDDLPRLLGRPPTTFARFADDARAAWAENAAHATSA